MLFFYVIVPCEVGWRGRCREVVPSVSKGVVSTMGHEKRQGQTKLDGRGEER